MIDPKAKVLVFKSLKLNLICIMFNKYPILSLYYSIEFFESWDTFKERNPRFGIGIGIFVKVLVVFDL